MGAAKTYNVNVEVIVTLPLALSLTTKEAKAICADIIEESESWARQAEDCIERAIDFELLAAIEEQLFAAIPSDIAGEIEGVAIKLKATDSPTAEINSFDVEVG